MKGQVWQLDFIFSLIMVTLVIGIFVSYVSLHIDDVAIEDLVQVTSSLSQSLVSEGIPTNWNASTVQLAGLTDGGAVINHTKLSAFYQLDNITLRQMFTDRYRYKVQIYNNSIPLTISGLTYVGFNLSDPNAQMQVNRYLVYNGSIVRMEVTLWE